MYHLGCKAVESTHQANNVETTVDSRIKDFILYSNQHRQSPTCTAHVSSKKQESEPHAEGEGRERNLEDQKRTKGKWQGPQEAALAKS